MTWYRINSPSDGRKATSPVLSRNSQCRKMIKPHAFDFVYEKVHQLGFNIPSHRDDFISW